MILSSSVNTTITPYYWAFDAQGISGAGGDTSGYINMDHLLPTKAYADVLIIDGVSALVTRAAHDIHWGMTVHSLCESNPATTIQHRLWLTSPTATQTTSAISMADLNIWTPLKAGYRLLEVTINALAAADSISASAWGHYMPLGAIPEPTPVNVQEFHLFRPRKVVGPV